MEDVESFESSETSAVDSAPTRTVPGDSPAVAIRITLLDRLAVMPTYARRGDAGADLTIVEAVELAPGQRALVRTGVAIELPPGFAAFVHPRSGLAARYGVSLVNAPGTIDSGYRGEIKVNLINHDVTQTVRLEVGDRVAQLVVQRVEHCTFHEVDVLSDSERGDGGHGSTGGFTPPEVT